MLNFMQMRYVIQFSTQWNTAYSQGRSDGTARSYPFTTRLILKRLGYFVAGKTGGGGGH